MVEWLERLDYGTESRRKVVSSRLGFALRRLENSLCHLFRIRQRKERDGLLLSSTVPKIQLDSGPHYGYYALANLYLLNSKL